MFADSQTKKYYIIPKEARHDYKNLINYWLHDIAEGAGFAWIIIERANGFFSNDKPCGFFAFEYRSTLQNARISYAIKPEFRRKGIATKVTKAVLDKLREQGVTSIEADVDKDNIPSQKVVENLGFTTNKRQALFDPEMMREGEVRSRHLWKKSLKGNLSNALESQLQRIAINAPQAVLIEAINKIVDIIKVNGQQPELMSKYLYLLGRVKFNEGNYVEATEAFGQCNMLIMDGGLPANHETFYWFARMREMDGKPDEAKMYYGFALENYSGDPSLISKEEIQQALI